MNAAGTLFTSIVENSKPIYANPPRQDGTPKRLHDNLRVATIDGEDFRLTRGERKRLARSLTISRIRAELSGEIEIAEKYLSSHQRGRLRMTRDQVEHAAGRAVREVA